MPNLQSQFIGLFCFINSFAIAQEPLNSAIAFSSLSRNPAMAGIDISDLQFNLCLHQQHQTVLVPYQTIQLQLLTRYRKKESEDGFTAGVLIRHDAAGENHLSRNQFQPVLNFHKSLSDVKTSFLSFGLMTEIIKSQFDINAIPFTDRFKIIPFNPATPILQILNKAYSNCLDFSTGVSFFEELNHRLSIYLGAALFHFGQNFLVNSNYEPILQKEVVLNTGLTFDENDFSIQFLSDLRFRSKNTSFYTALLYGVPLSKYAEIQNAVLKLGIYYNSRNELSPIISINWPSLALSINYDIYLGNQTEISVFKNAFELNTSFNINSHKRNNESEKMKCQRFR